ncbi:hypothetical protein DFP73DRAFT_597272 [Morchella snyderi]|nr:hypothetical protein DFP73DRAFT_597272 [Morchella snyderi]
MHIEHHCLPRWHDLALHPSSKTCFLVDNTGAPFFWLADTAWELFHALDSSEVDIYLPDRESKGYTAVQVVAIAENDGLVVPNRNRDLPLVDADTTKPVEAYFEYIDGVVDKARALGDESCISANLGSPRDVPFMEDTTRLVASGQLTARWYAPRNGSYAVVSGPVERRINITFRPPSTGTTDNDWVLHVEV